MFKFHAIPAIAAAVLLIAPLLASDAHATTITGTLAVDDLFTLYLSTSDSQLGTQLLSGNGWNLPFTLNPVQLSSGDTYFLHVIGRNTGGDQGFIGSFTVSDTDFEFANGTQSLNTNADDWKASVSDQFGTLPPTDTPLVEAFYGSVPWGFVSGIDPSASWIWSNPIDAGYVTFSTQISYVGPPVNPPAATPEPATFAMMGGVLMALPWLIRRKK